MDGSNMEHSDSDSGESWSLVEHIPSYGDEVPEFPEGIPLHDRNVSDANAEKDEDTDGISIISDSDPEPSMPFEANYKSNTDDDFSHLHPQYVTLNPPDPGTKELHESMRSEDDFLGNNAKHKTYVHKRNKRLSTVLNIIVLGSVITAAGVAIGHMWGAKNDCIMNTTPSVNKILSNLYKLQEENAYLRSKLKELTLMNNLQTRKSGTENTYKPQNKCKKVFEDSLSNFSEKPTKCVDNGDIPRTLSGHNIVELETEHGKDFIRDIDKLKQVYKHNKSWLDEEVTKRILDEQQAIKRMKNKLTKEKSDATNLKGEHYEHILEPIIESNTDTLINTADKLGMPENYEDKNSTPERKISYADSLKSKQILKDEAKKEYVLVGNNIKDFNKKKPHSKDVDTLSGLSVSEDEFKKDDRYTGNKHKQERKKHDRQKIHKKQKRKNKYEQWEMKGGYLKDYDDFSISSSQENEYVLKNPDKNFLAKDFERDNYIKDFVEIDIKNSDKNDAEMKLKGEKRIKINGKNKEKDIAWYEKRAVFRNEARKKLEHELFGETSPNNAGWYFRRMQRREQCRAKGDNSTYRKLSKRNMNFKMKH